jgi:DNA-binding transcriptional ArsR family regulator
MAKRGSKSTPPAAAKPLTGEARFAQPFAALGEPTRLRIMQILPRQPICDQMYNVIELAEELGLTQPTVSHHLKILSEAGLIQCRRQCNSLYFYVNQEAVLHWLKDVKCRFGCEEGA